MAAQDDTRLKRMQALYENYIQEYIAEVRAAREAFIQELQFWANDYDNANYETSSPSDKGGSYTSSVLPIPASASNDTPLSMDRIYTYGEVSLNKYMCQIPANPANPLYPDRIVLPTGTSRLSIQKLVYNWRATNKDAGLVPLNTDLFDFSPKNIWMNKFDPKLVHYLTILYYKVRDVINQPKIHIASGFRTVEYNKHLTKVNPNAADISPHCAGWAVDIAVTGSNRKVIADAAYDLNFGGIAIGKNFVHIDISVYGRWSYGDCGIKYIKP